MKFSNTGMEENLANEIRMTPRVSNFVKTKNTFQEETVCCIKCSSQVNKNRDVTIRYSCAKIIVILTTLQKNYKNETLITVCSKENGRRGNRNNKYRQFFQGRQLKGI